MINHKEHFHGSDLEKIEQIYGIKKEEIISFSANVNPLGISGRLKEALSERLDAITSYPDREYTNLRKCMGAYCHADYENIIVGNGSTELISIFTQIKHPKNALVLGPTYSEYEREISLGGGSCSYYPLKEEMDFQLQTDDFINHLNESIDLLVICNPNNPTSTAVTRTDLCSILDKCKEYDILVMVDETYVEFAENYEEITAIPLTDDYDNIVILRGISKFFAAPGLRLGYAITGNKELIQLINTQKNPWTINSLAEIAGELMFTDTDYIQKTKCLIKEERNRIYNELKKFDSIKVYKPTANFILLKILKDDITADQLFEAAIKEKMMIRNCATFPYLNERFIRFCFMKPEDNSRLLDCLKKIL